MIGHTLFLSFGAFLFACQTFWFFFRRYMVSRATVLEDLDAIGQNRAHAKLRGTAVICGGSIAGLLAARVCSNHFQDVIIVEAENWVTSSDGYSSHRQSNNSHKRSHVPQYTAAHIFQPLLVTALLRWFPNFEKEIQSVGGSVLPYKPCIYVSGKPLATPAYPDFIPPSMNISRPGLEMLLRKLVLTSCPNVRYISGIVTGLIQESSRAITGVRVRNTNTEGECVLLISLVIDCTGPASAGLRWLKELAKDNGSRDTFSLLDSLRMTYNPKLSYRTCEFSIPSEVIDQLEEAGFPENWETSTVPLVCFPDAKRDNRLLAVLRKDNDHLEYLCGGWDMTEKISTIQDIKRYIENMETREPLPNWVMAVLDVLETNNVPLKIETTRLGSTAYVPYHLCKDLPPNFIALGDSVMVVNPVRGVGCTKACAEALTLNRILFDCIPDPRSGKIDTLPSSFSERYFQLLAQKTGHEWDAYKAEDYAWKTTIPSKGDDLSFGKNQRVFADMLVELLHQDSDVMWTFFLVKGWLAPPTDFLAPKILLKLLWLKLRSAMRRTTT